jgi:hypothetical protein
LLPTGGEFSASPSSPDTSDAAAVAAAAATTGPVVTLRTEHIVNGTLIKPPTLGGSRLATRHDLSPGGGGGGTKVNFLRRLSTHTHTHAQSHSRPRAIKTKGACPHRKKFF